MNQFPPLSQSPVAVTNHALPINGYAVMERRLCGMSRLIFRTTILSAVGSSSSGSINCRKRLKSAPPRRTHCLPFP